MSRIRSAPRYWTAAQSRVAFRRQKIKWKSSGVVQEAFLEGTVTTKHSLCTKKIKLILHWGEAGFLQVDLGGKAAGTQAKARTKT